MVAYRLGDKSDELITKILSFKCTQSQCHALKKIIEGNSNITDNAGALKRFLEELSKPLEMIDSSVGTMSDAAYKSFAKVMNDLGHKSIAVQSGAAHVIMSMSKLVDELPGSGAGKIVKFEDPVKIGLGGKYGTHIYDIVIEKGGKTYNIEMKAWDPDIFSGFIESSLTGLGKVSGKTDVVPGQLSKDLIDALNSVDLRVNNGALTELANGVLANIKSRWVFDSRITSSASGKANEVIDILNNNKGFAEGLLKRLNGYNNADLSEKLVDDFIESRALKEVLETIFGVGSL